MQLCSCNPLTRSNLARARLAQRATGLDSPVEAVAYMIDYLREAGAYGYAIFAAAMIFLQVVPIAAAFVLTVSAGAIFGAVKGTATVLTCSTISATISFLIARTFGRELVLETASRSPQYQVSPGPPSMPTSHTHATHRPALHRAPHRPRSIHSHFQSLPLTNPLDDVWMIFGWHQDATTAHPSFSGARHRLLRSLLLHLPHPDHPAPPLARPPLRVGKLPLRTVWSAGCGVHGGHGDRVSAAHRCVRLDRAGTTSTIYTPTTTSSSSSTTTVKSTWQLGAEIVVNGSDGTNPLLLAAGVLATLGAVTLGGNIASSALKDMDIEL